MVMQNSYDHIAEQWHANFRGQAYVDRTLGYADKVLEGLPPQVKVLDLGCGTGNPIAKHIVERGFRVVGVDQSKKLLEIARTVVPEADLIHADMVEIQFNEKFAAAVAWDSVFTSSANIIQPSIANSLTLLNWVEGCCCQSAVQALNPMTQVRKVVRRICSDIRFSMMRMRRE